MRYVYNQDTGNLIQVLKLVDRSAGAYTTNTYRYDNANFPHCITEIDNARGIPGKTNIYAYDTRGNVTAITNALGTTVQQISTSGYDDVGNQIAATNALGVITRVGYDTNSFALAVTNAFGTSLQQLMTNSYDANGLPLVTTDARGFSSTNAYESRGLLLNVGTIDGIVVTNFYDATYGWLVGTVDATSVVTTNYYDSATGNLTKSSAGYYSGSTLECAGHNHLWLRCQRQSNRGDQRARGHFPNWLRRAESCDRSHQCLRLGRAVHERDDL